MSGIIQRKLEDVAFQQVYNKIRGYTLVDSERCYILYQLSKHTQGFSLADIAEVGVYKGGTAKLLSECRATKQSTLFLFDTFEGMPTTDPIKDKHHTGDFNDTSVEAVTKLLGDMGGIEIRKGLFPATALDMYTESFRLVHVDCDIYTSVKECCKFFYPKVITGGVMVFDDYGFPSCPGAKQAVDEFCDEMGIQSIYLSTGQALIIKV